LSFKNAAEDVIKEQLLKQVKEFVKNNLEGRVPVDALDPALIELERELDSITLFS